MRARTLLFLLLAAGAFAALPSAAGAAKRGSAHRFVLPVPNAGDVTLARVLIASRPRHAGQLSAFTLGRARGAAPPAGTAVAYMGDIERFRGGRRLMDLTFAVARPASAQGGGADAIAIKLGGFNLRARVVGLAGESNARFFVNDRTCMKLALPAQNATISSGIGGPGGWDGRISQRQLVLGALAWGCPTSGFPSDPAFEAPMDGALGTGFVTWGLAGDGSQHVCVYVHDAPGVSGQVIFNEHSLAPAAVPYTVPAAGVVVVRTAADGGAAVTLTRTGSGGRTWRWETAVVTLLPTAPPVPAALAAAAGGCP